MAQRNHVTLVMFFGSIAWAVLLVWHGVSVSWNWCSYFGTAVSVAAFGYSIFDRWAWRWGWINPFAHMPDLNGTWRVILQSSFIREGETEPIPPITAYMAVRQTYSTLSMRQMTQESESYLLTGKVIRTEDGCYEVAAVFQNTPQQALRDRSEIHYGAFLLRVRDEEVISLDGEYWTSRKTRGQMKFEERRSEVHHCYGTASKAFGQDQVKAAPPTPAR